MTTVPKAVQEALQEYIDRTLTDLHRQYSDNAEADNALLAGRKLGRLEEWLAAQKRGDSAIVPPIPTDS